MEVWEGASRAVVERIAAAEDVDPNELRQPLASVVDPDALDSLFDPENAAGYVSFEYCGYDVTVYHDDEVEIREGSTTGL